MLWVCGFIHLYQKSFYSYISWHFWDIFIPLSLVNQNKAVRFLIGCCFFHTSYGPNEKENLYICFFNQICKLHGVIIYLTVNLCNFIYTVIILAYIKMLYNGWVSCWIMSHSAAVENYHVTTERKKKKTMSLCLVK